MGQEQLNSKIKSDLSNNNILHQIN